MFPKFALTSMIGSGLFLGVAVGADQNFRFQLINYPGAASTNPQGINAAGDIVGRYRDSSNAAHGFLWRHNEQLPVRIDVPDWFAGGHVVYTDARGINPEGDIVGYYMMEGDDPVAGRGFLRSRDGTFVAVHPPVPHLNVYLQRVLPDRTILGCFHDHDTMMSMYGAVLRGGVWAAFPMAMSMTNGGTPDLSLETGFTIDMMVTPNRQRAFLLRKGDPNPFLFDYDFNRSNNVAYTSAWDMNPLGAVVGNYKTGTDPQHGFLFEGGAFTSIEFQGDGLIGPTVSSAVGINVHDDIVGSYTDPSTGGAARGFVATPINREHERSEH